MAKSDPGSVVAGAGLLVGIFTALRDEVVRRSGTDIHLHRLVRPEGRDTIARMAELVVGQTDADVYELDVDYGDGRGVQRVRFRELAFDHNPLDDEVLARAEQLDCRQPEEVEARKAVSRYTPDQLREHPRVGLIGPAVQRDGHLGRACVLGDGLGVDLVWLWAGGRWDRRYRFVVVCK